MQGRCRSLLLLFLDNIFHEGNTQFPQLLYGIYNIYKLVESEESSRVYLSINRSIDSSFSEGIDLDAHIHPLLFT